MDIIGGERRGIEDKQRDDAQYKLRIFHTVNSFNLKSMTNYISRF